MKRAGIGHCRRVARRAALNSKASQYRAIAVAQVSLNDGREGKK
jgi:hypothetical protein